MIPSAPTQQWEGMVVGSGYSIPKAVITVVSASDVCMYVCMYFIYFP